MKDFLYHEENDSWTDSLEFFWLDECTQLRVLEWKSKFEPFLKVAVEHPEEEFPDHAIVVLDPDFEEP